MFLQNRARVIPRCRMTKKEKKTYPCFYSFYIKTEKGNVTRLINMVGHTFLRSKAMRLDNMIHLYSIDAYTDTLYKVLKNVYKTTFFLYYHYQAFFFCLPHFMRLLYKVFEEQHPLDRERMIMEKLVCHNVIVESYDVLKIYVRKIIMSLKRIIIDFRYASLRRINRSYVENVSEKPAIKVLLNSPFYN